MQMTRIGRIDTDKNQRHPRSIKPEEAKDSRDPESFPKGLTFFATQRTLHYMYTNKKQEVFSWH